MHAFEVTLRNGERLRLRPVEPDDETQLAALLQASRSRLPVRLPAARTRPAGTATGHPGHAAWVAVAPAGPGSPVVAAGLYLRRQVDSVTADATVAVASRFRGLGLGRLLMETLLLVALENRVARLVIRAEQGDVVAGRLVRGLGARAVPADDGSLDYIVPVGWGDRTLVSSSGFRAPRVEQLRAMGRGFGDGGPA
jgi:GNAT superfamily N-acetyltransferase